MPPTQEMAYEPSPAERVALTTIIHHYCLKTQITRKHIAEAVKLEQVADTGETISGRKILDNFLQKASRQGAGELYIYFKSEVTKKLYYDSAPDHIKSAIQFVYNIAKDAPPTFTSFNESFLAIADKDPSLVDSIENAYVGRWSVIRYSGQTVDGDSDPFVIRAAMEIFPRNTDRSELLPTFRINYRPLSKTNTDDFYEVEGSIISLHGGQHMYFVGREFENDNPLDIMAFRSHAKNQKSILGIVKRKQEDGRIIVSRVMFLRSDAKNISELRPKIGTFRVSELKELCRDENLNLDHVFRLIKNKVPNDGRGCLML